MTMARLWPFFDQFSQSYSPPLVFVEVYDPVWLRCQDAVEDAIRALGLEGIADASIICLEQPYNERYFGTTTDGAAKNVSPPLAYPGIIVWPFQNEVVSLTGGTNARDEIAYPIAVSIVDKGAGRTGDNAMVGDRDARRLHMLWRELISRRFRFAAWPDLPEIRESQVAPNLYALPSLYANNDLYHGAIVINFVSWETRYPVEVD